MVTSTVGRLVLLSTSPRVAAGLLSWPAWEALGTADLVAARDGAHPLLPHVEAAGVEVEVLAPAGDRELARRLVDAATASVVVYLTAPDGDAGLAAELATGLAAAGDSAPELEALPGSWDVPGARLLDLVAVMDRLRSTGGCPWDAAQTHESLVKYLLEEAYETVEVIETGDRDGLREELGDLLLQVVFHSRLAEETDEPWSIDDVAAGIVSKLINRHPHVFGDVDAPTAAHVEATWETIKLAEKGRTSAVEGVPLAQPALALAAKLMSRAEKHGLSVPVPIPEGNEPDVGDLLLSIVAMAALRDIDPEAALRDAARRYAGRMRRAETEG